MASVTPATSVVSQDFSFFPDLPDALQGLVFHRHITLAASDREMKKNYAALCSTSKTYRQIVNQTLFHLTLLYQKIDLPTQILDQIPPSPEALPLLQEQCNELCKEQIKKEEQPIAQLHEWMDQHRNVCCYITRLSFANTKYRQVSFWDMRDILPIASKTLNLQAIDVSACRSVNIRSLSKLFAQCPEINEVHVTGCRYIPGDDLCTIPTLIPRLRILDLQHLDVVTTDLLGRMQSLLPHLHTLMLSSCPNVTDEGIKTLLMQGNMKALRCLHLSSITSITNQTLGHLSRYCSQLENLDVSNTNISDQGLRALGAGCTLLKEIYMNVCLKVRVSGVRMLLHSNRSLQLVSLFHTRVSKDELTQLRQDYPRVSFLSNL